MKLTFTQINFEKDIDFILWHQQDDTPAWWRAILFQWHPDLDKAYADSLPYEERKKYLTKEMRKILKKNDAKIKELVYSFQNEWDQKVAKDLNAAFSSAFDNNCQFIANNCLAEIGLNPVCPRDIGQYTFQVFFKDPFKYVLETACHEMTHFIWFYFWHKHFKDSHKEYDYPHLKWKLSEIVVETIIRHSPILNLFFENPKYIAYNYFYDMKIGGKSLFDAMKEMYLNRKNIFDFMEQSYQYVLKNETELNEKIKEAEK